jgi:uncharacterized membrane protein YgaE (UPF0421/DUF939 family)
MAYPPTRTLHDNNRLRHFWDAFVTWHTRIDSPRLEYAQGFRAAVGIFVPIAFGWAENRVDWGIVAALSTFWVLLCDTGGAYRHKVASMTGAALVMIAAFIVGAWTCQSDIIHLLAIFLWLAVAAFFGVAGSAAAQAGLISSTMFIATTALLVPGEFEIRTILCCVGALFGLSLSVAFWPLHIFSPVFNQLSISYLRLAELLDVFWIGTASNGRTGNNLPFALAFDSFITQLETTRTTWGTIRAGRAGPSNRTVQLVRLIEAIDSAAGSVVALRQLFNSAPIVSLRFELALELRKLTNVLASTARDLARSIPKRGRGLDSVEAEATLKRLKDKLRALIEATDSWPSSSMHELENGALNLVRQLRTATKTVASLESDQIEGEDIAEPQSTFQPEPFRFWPQIWNNLSFESDGLRHALRLGLTAAFGQFIASYFHLDRGYWIAMTVLVVLKPNFGGTLQRAVQRITGTVVGALVAAVLSWNVRNPVILLAILPVLAFATFCLRPINYGLFTLALTPMIMVMLDVGEPGNWEMSFQRVFHTLLGGALAVLGGYLLFPVWERDKLPTQIAAAIKANAEFLHAIVTRRTEEKDQERILRRRQRKAGLALANAATISQRVLSEPARSHVDVASPLAAINDLRDIFHTLSAIKESQSRPARLVNDLYDLGTALASFLEELAAAAFADKPLPRPTDVESWKDQLRYLQEQDRATSHTHATLNLTQEEWVFTQFETLIEAIQALHSAISRLHGEEEVGGEWSTNKEGRTALHSAAKPR